MSRYVWVLQLALAAGIGVFASESCRAQGSNVIVNKTEIINKLNLTKIDGPYSFKSPEDRIAIVGFVTSRKGDDAEFRDCSGKTRNVKFQDLVRIQRNCPSRSPVGPWVISKEGRIVPLAGNAKDIMVYRGLEKMEIDPGALPADYQQPVKDAKAGEWVAVSFPSDNGKPNLSFITKAGVQPTTGTGGGAPR